MPNQHNQQQVELIKDKLGKAKSAVIVDYAGTTVNDQVQLRRAITESGGEFLVTKNTLIDIAAGKGKLSDSLNGMNAIVFSYEDEVASAKILGEFRKDKEKKDKIFFLGGILENKLLSRDQVEALSLLPSKQELYAKMVGSMNAPISGFVNVLAGNLRGLATVLKAIAEKK